MFQHKFYRIIYVCLFLYITQSCISEPLYPPQLVLYSMGEPEYTDVLVKREGDNLTLICELRDDTSILTSYVWNYIPDNVTVERTYTVEGQGPSLSSRLLMPELAVTDSGQFMCSAPPFSVTKRILVQTRGPLHCAKGAFWCGQRCVLAAYVCDGFPDCEHGEDESEDFCPHQVCSRSDKLNCSGGRCISAGACCRRRAALCPQPACCDHHPSHAPLEGYVDVEFPKQFEDRHAPDDYGFIQSTIYTVTACALIFMLAVVLLVSAICKMHMKRAALRQYTQPPRDHYLAQSPRFPPCYEASRLLQSGITPPTPPTPPVPPTPPRGLARLATLFQHRYTEVPTQPMEVELSSLPSSPSHSLPSSLPHYRPPPFPHAEYIYANAEYPGANPELVNTNDFDNTQDLRQNSDFSQNNGDFSGNDGGFGRNDAEFATNSQDIGRFNYIAPVDVIRRRAIRRNTLERVFDQIDRQRLTLQLGRFQFSIPRFGRERPDTPNVAEININDLDFVRLNSNDTYTLNGRTIRLLGANFENYPCLGDGNRPPSYNDAVRYKLYGPPPEYLSREGLNQNGGIDDEARSNVEMPPCYDELGSNRDEGGSESNGLGSGGNGVGSVSDEGGSNVESVGNVIGCNSASNVNVPGYTGNRAGSVGDVAGSNVNSLGSNATGINNNNNENASVNDTSSSVNSTVVNKNNGNLTGSTGAANNVISTSYSTVNGNNASFNDTNDDNGNVETISSIIDHLPAIDDVNANDNEVTGFSNVNVNC